MDAKSVILLDSFALPNDRDLIVIISFIFSYCILLCNVCTIDTPFLRRGMQTGRMFVRSSVRPVTYSTIMHCEQMTGPRSSHFCRHMQVDKIS